MGKWSELKAAEKARVIQFAIRQGVSDIQTIRDTFNNIYAQGGKIHIDPSKKGTFTATASKHGKSVQAFASQVLAHKENYSPAMVKKANFARNAAHWHQTGGPLYPFSFGPLPAVRYAEGGKKTEGSVDPATIASRQAYAESTYRDSAGSRVGAKGIFQIMQPTLDDYNKANKDSVKLEDLTSTDTSLAVRNWYMGNLLGASFIDKPESTDSVRYAKALAAYNWGRGNVLKALNKAKAAGEDIYDSWGWLPYLEQEPRDYVNFILRGMDINPSHKNEVMYQAAKTLNKSKDTKIRNSQK